jgi:uncharacterized membrane protein
MRYGVIAVGTLCLMLATFSLVVSGTRSLEMTLALAFVVCGATLVWLGISGRRIGWVGWIAVAVLAPTAAVGSLLVDHEQIACMYCYHRAQGFPLAFLDTGFTHEDMPTVQRAHEIMAANPGIASRGVDWMALVVNGLFWLCVVVSIVVVIRLVRTSIVERSSRRLEF